jgi:hypothetical protein
MLSVMRALPNMAGGCLALGVAAAIALAGCGTAHTPAASTRTTTATAGQTPKQRAEAEAAALLGSFVPPPGAARLPKAPEIAGGYLKTPITYLGDAYQVDGTTFWQAPGAPQAVLNWEIAHISHRFSLGDADFGVASDRSFELPPVPGVLTSRDLVVEVAGLGDGRTGIRVDAEVGWQPPRPASDQVPPAARVVTIAEETTMETGQGMPSPVTITDPAVVARLAALVDGLPIAPFNGISVSCPPAFGSFLALAFRASGGGQALATVHTDQSCGVTIFSPNPNQDVALTQTSALDQQILDIAGLSWKIG